MYPFVKEDGFILANVEAGYSSGAIETSVYDNSFQEIGKMVISAPLKNSILISKDKQIIFDYFFIYLMEGNVSTNYKGLNSFFNLTVMSDVVVADYIVVGAKIYIALQAKGAEYESDKIVSSNVFIKVEGDEIVKISEIHDADQFSKDILIRHYDNKFYLKTPNLPLFGPTKVRFTSFDPMTGRYKNYEFGLSSLNFENYHVSRSDIFLIVEGVLYKMYILVQDNSQDTYAVVIENLETNNAYLLQLNSFPFIDSNILVKTYNIVRGYSVVPIYGSSTSGYYLGIAITPHKENEFTPISSQIDYVPYYSTQTFGTATGKLYFIRYHGEITVDVVYPNQIAEFINQYLSLPSQITLVGADIIPIVYLIIINRKKEVLKAELYPKEE